MADAKIALIAPDDIQRHIALVERIADRYHGDPGFRAQVDRNGAEALRGMGLELPDGVQVKVVVSTDDHVYLAMPPDPNVDLDDEALTAIAGGSSSGTAGSASSVSTLSSFTATIGCLACAGTAGTAGSN